MTSIDLSAFRMREEQGLLICRAHPNGVPQIEARGSFTSEQTVKAILLNDNVGR